VGGDGVAFCCHNGIVGIPNAELALMPFCTTNNFVRAFGLERSDDFRNIGLQADSGVIPVDVIKCNGNYALNFCTVGTESAGFIKMQPSFERFESLRRRFQLFTRLLFTTAHSRRPLTSALRVKNTRFPLTGKI
jgi:diacylglycerol kinase family enzyme